MYRATTGLLFLALTACATAAPEDIKSGFDPALAEGHSLNEHTEVSPGVYMLNTVIDEGLIRFVPDEDPLLPEELDTELDLRSTAKPKVSTCYNYDYASYNDQTSNSTMWGGNPTWYGTVDAYSYRYTDHTGTTTRYNRVSAYAYTTTPAGVEYLSSMAYVYVNGAYVGYVNHSYSSSTSSTSPSYSYAWGSWDVACPRGGSIDVSATLYHQASDYSGAQQYLYIGNTLNASTACCPG